jgi:hypothetical protein
VSSRANLNGKIGFIMGNQKKSKTKVLCGLHEKTGLFPVQVDLLDKT